MYVEGLQIVDNIARGFKDLAIGGRIPQSLSFVSSIDITRIETQNKKMQVRPDLVRLEDPSDLRVMLNIRLAYTPF